MKAKGLFGWVFVLAVAIAASASAAKLSSSVPKGWIEDFEAAKKEAAAGGKYILLAFSGSDWCGWCMKLEQEVFSQNEFVRSAQKSFVLTMMPSGFQAWKSSWCGWAVPAPNSCTVTSGWIAA